MDLEKFREESERSYPANRALIQHIKKKKPKDLDDNFHQLHEKAFNEIDCLSCANCCSTTSPIFYSNDIERASRALKMKVGDFESEYLKVDEDGDFVLKSSPCPFLGVNNECLIYENRPKACREYPHTNRKRMKQILSLTLKNTKVCPATLQIVNHLKEIYPGH